MRTYAIKSIRKNSLIQAERDCQKDPLDLVFFKKRLYFVSWGGREEKLNPRIGDLPLFCHHRQNLGLNVSNHHTATSPPPLPPFNFLTMPNPSPFFLSPSSSWLAFHGSGVRSRKEKIIRVWRGKIGEKKKENELQGKLAVVVHIFFFKR